MQSVSGVACNLSSRGLMVSSQNRAAVNADVIMVWVGIPRDAGEDKAKEILLIGRLSYDSDLGVDMQSLRPHQRFLCHHHLHRAAGGVHSSNPRPLMQAMGTI